VNEAQKRILRDAESKMSVDLSFQEIKKNAGPSAAQYAGDIVQTVMNPIDTAAGLWHLAKGVGDKMGMDFNGIDESEAADTVWAAMKDRYGSADSIKNTINTDPVGFIGDLSGVLSGGAGLTTKVPALSKALNLASKMEPLTVVGKGLSLAAKTIPKSLPERLYSSAAKFGRSIDEPRAISAALEHDILPNKKGQQKLSKYIAEKGQRIDDIVDAGVDSGVTIDPLDILSDLEASKTSKGRFLPDSPAYGRAVDSKIDDLINYSDQEKIDALTPREALEFRRRGDDLVNYSNRGDRMSADPIAEDINKVLADSTREKLGTVIPEIGDINADIGPALELQKGLNQRVPAMQHRNIVSLHALGTSGLGSLLGSVVGSPTIGAALGYAVGAMDMPSIKSRLALGINKLRRGDSALLTTLTKKEANMLLVLASRTNDELEAEGILIGE